MTISTLSYKLLFRLQPSHKPECPVEKKRTTAFKAKVTAKVKNVSKCLSGWYLLNRRAFCSQTWYGDAASWARVSCAHEPECHASCIHERKKSNISGLSLNLAERFHTCAPLSLVMLTVTACYYHTVTHYLKLEESIRTLVMFVGAISIHRNSQWGITWTSTGDAEPRVWWSVVTLTVTVKVVWISPGESEPRALLALVIMLTGLTAHTDTDSRTLFDQIFHTIDLCQSWCKLRY